MTEYRRIFTDMDRRAWEFVTEVISDPDGTELMSNRAMAEVLGLKEDRQGSRLYRRLEDFGLIVTAQVREPITHKLCRRVWRNDNGVIPGFAQRSSMVVIHHVKEQETHEPNPAS